MSRTKNCRETIFVSQLSRNHPHRGGNFERWKNFKSPLLWGRDSLGGILGDNLGESNCESNTISRQWGDNFCRETSSFPWCLDKHQGKPPKHQGIFDTSEPRKTLENCLCLKANKEKELATARALHRSSVSSFSSLL